MMKKLNPGNMKSKAQIKMAETIGVMFIFFMLLVLVMIFYTRMQAGKVVEEKEEQFIRKSIEISQIMAFLPEVQCSRNNVIEDNCFDLYKLKALGELMVDNENMQLYYFDQFEYSKIEIERAYPTGESILVYDYVKEPFTGLSMIPIPIIIYDPIERTHGFAVLKVSTYK